VTDWTDDVAPNGPTTRSVDASTATGPIKAAATAAKGFEVLRHEHESEPDAPCDSVRAWSIGHSCRSPWSQVHSAPTGFAHVIEHSVVGTEIRSASWNTSQPAARRASRGRIQNIRVKGYHVLRIERREMAR
jgi:hypothetical protein